MASSICNKAFASFECRSDSDFFENLRHRHSTNTIATVPFHHLSSSPRNFQRQLSTKSRRNCSNIGVAQIVANSNNNSAAAAAAPPSPPPTTTDTGAGLNQTIKPKESVIDRYSFLKCDGSKTIHAAERLGRGTVTDAITTPIVNTTAYFFKKTSDLIDYKEKRQFSFEYGRYGNPTTVVLEEKMSVLEGAESTLFMASGMCTSTVMFMALVPAGGHIVTTTDCYSRTRIFIGNVLPKMGITATIIDPADVDSLERALEQNNVSLFFTETPTNPFQRCVDIKLVSELCHKKGALVCIDGTFATPINQKALALGADLVVNSATKYIAGHHDVLAGCISGSEKLISQVRSLHFILGGTLSPNSAYLVLRGMKTLHLRVRQQNSSAMKAAKILEAHPKVKSVYYPGLPSHPEHELAKRQMTGFGGVLCFEIDGDIMKTMEFVDSLKIPYIAPSFGGCESVVNQPAIMSYWDLPRSERAKYKIYDNLVRFCFGLEDYEDLEEDIMQALEAL
ncbi:cystathionine gamma-synthase 1, chloroplastic-like [Gastrolobium bilobum]|uniref:cystathionine gamma-synthase 1, chloroplastic-like n=1 Tax=Gastrolobium bilobum TaxID=150636 RepID=UPI002AB0D781|nr:cystathionine gamma-synthase 1, chloroplastic-like [Gastrolobium bilobum]